MKKLIAVVLLIASGIALFLGPFTFHGRSICERCGMTRWIENRQLPFSDLTYWHRETDAASPLSRALQRLGVPGTHAHSWIFERGSGNGVQ